MLIRKSVLAAAIALPVISHAEIYDARSFARGGAGLTMGEYNQAILNPALINKSDENDDFSFALNVGALASDEEGVIEEVDEISDAIDRLENSGSSADAADIDLRLQGIDGDLVQLDAGLGLLIAIPNKTLPAALVVRSKAAAGVAFNYSSQDSSILQDIANNALPTPGNDTNGDGTIDGDDLTSTAEASVVGIAEAGLMFGHTFGAIETGLTVKLQRIELLSYEENVNNFDTGDLSDSDTRKTYNHLNADLGANLRLGENGSFVISGVVENLVPKSFEGPVDSMGDVYTYDMKPVAVLGAGYGNTYFKAEVNADLTTRSGFGLLQETQFMRAGLELSAGRHLHLRAGYRVDTKDNVSDLITAGLGITPFDRLNIDIAAAKGDGDTLGAVLQIGFKI